MNREIIEALAWALIHFTWQGALVALAAGLARASLGPSRPQARYAVLIAALAVMAAMPVVTTVSRLIEPQAVAGPATVEAPRVIALTIEAAAPTVPPAASASSWRAALVAGWSGIAALLSLRSFGGWLKIQTLARRNTAPVAKVVEATVRAMCERLGVRRTVQVVLSLSAEVPGVVGWLKPVILLPVGIATALTPEQIEQILAHELAHVRRHDYLVNLFQTVVENVLFYHPAVWWISGQVRVERENCCDDLAVATCGDATAYAGTLAQLETLRGTTPDLLPAASGGSLVTRIRRILRQDGTGRAVPAWFGAVVPLAIAALAFASVPAPRAEDEPTAAPAPDSASEPAPASAAKPVRQARSGGYLAGLADAGYTDVSVEDIIMLKDRGVDPPYIKRMLGAGLGRLEVDQLVRLHDHGVGPEYAASIVASGLASDLDVENVIRLHDHGVSGEEMRGIRALGFGPYSVEDVIRLRHNGADAETFEALKEAGLPRAGAGEAIQFRQLGITTNTIREASRQGFDDLTFEQILKLRRAGVI